MPKHKIAKTIFIIGIIVTVVEIIANIDMSLYLHSTQYVPEGGHAEPIRVADILNDFVQPFFHGTVLYAFALIVDKIKAPE